MQKRSQFMPLDKPSIKVLICTHNRVELLLRTIDFLNETSRPNNYQISLFVVANACTDETPRYLNQYQESLTSNQLPLTWIAEQTPGKSNALNSAISKLDATIIAMVDDDHRVDTHYFIAIDHALKEYPEADFFCGKIIPDWDGSEPYWVHEQGKYRIYPLPVPRFELGERAIPVNKEVAVPGGGNLIIKSTLFKTVGNFSTQLGPIGHNLGGGEDYDWVIRAYKAGARLQYIPGILQFHYVDKQRLKLTYITKKAFERSCSVVRIIDATKAYSGLLFPRYLFKKTSIYLFKCIFSITNSARRFYLVRLAASLGEINGFFMAKKTKN